MDNTWPGDTSADRSDRPRVLISGAGIGGLALAALLSRRGFPIVVFEKSTQLSEIGAGVQLSANAVKVLRAAGVEATIRSTAFEPLQFIGRSWRSGRTLYRTPIKPQHEARYGAPYLHIHRADLHQALRAVVPSDAIRLGSCVEHVEPLGDRVMVRLSSGLIESADVVVGADGIHSAVRRSLFGQEGPRFTGNVCWRGLIPTDQLPGGLIAPAASNWMGPNGHVVHYYLRGGALVNFVAIRESASWTEESWTTPSSREALIAAYPGWNRQLRTLFERAEGVFQWGLFDRDPLPQWSAGRVTLLGDAAHPMLPFMAQGTAQALEDAYVLADWLDADRCDPVRALKRYEAERRPRTSRIQLAARARGQNIHLSSAWARYRRDLGFIWQRVTQPGATAHQAEWIFEHDVTQVQRQVLHSIEEANQ